VLMTKRKTNWSHVAWRNLLHTCFRYVSIDRASHCHNTLNYGCNLVECHMKFVGELAMFAGTFRVQE
jgi:hypothetical protein